MVEQGIRESLTEKTIICKLCGAETKTLQTENIKCNNCLAIIDSEGKVLYPPQINDWSIRCPNVNCNMSDWLTEKRTKDDAIIRCNSCQTRYKIKFKKEELTEIQKLLNPLYTGRVYCLQCDTLNSFTQIYSINKREVKCTGCGLKFEFDIAAAKNKKKIKEITKIPNKIKEPELVKAHIEGGKGMLIISKYHRIIDTPSFDKLNERLIGEDYKGMEIASISIDERKEKTDDLFAVVIRVKDKTTGEIKKIRKYPIHDAIHIKNSWVAINQETAKDFFEKYGTSIEKAKIRIERAGKELGADVKEAVKDYNFKVTLGEKNKLVKEAVGKIRKLKNDKVELVKASMSEIKPLKEKLILKEGSIKDLEKQLEEKDLEVASVKKFYMDNSALILERMKMLGEEYLEVASISREKLVENDYFELCKFRKQEGDNDLAGMEVASKVIGNKKKGKNRIQLAREKIDKQAFPEKYEKR